MNIKNCNHIINLELYCNSYTVQIYILWLVFNCKSHQHILQKKKSTILYCYVKCETCAQVLSTTCVHGNSKNEASREEIICKEEKWA